jgi:hypothetical protein
MQAARSARHGRFLGFIGVTAGILCFRGKCASGALPSATAHTRRSASRQASKQAGKTLGCCGGRAGGVPPPLASAAGTGRAWWRTDRQYKLSAGNGPECSLTPWSRGAPTACHQGPACGTRCIVTVQALVAYRRRPLTSNVRPQKRPRLLHSVSVTIQWRNVHRPRDRRISQLA